MKATGVDMCFQSTDGFGVKLHAEPRDYRGVRLPVYILIRTQTINKVSKPKNFTEMPE